MQSVGNPGIGFRSEVPDNAEAGENIVLAALARVHIELGNTRPEVSTFTAQAESVEDLHIESEACLDCPGGSPCCARVMAASEEQSRALSEMAKPAAKTDPRRNCLIGKDVQPCSGSHEIGRILLRYSVG